MLDVLAIAFTLSVGLATAVATLHTEITKPWKRSS